ncbi:MAG: succinate dehydrogenase, cytochrome b556 subunit [Methylococcaceae bacterium]|nr:succinate dehydrogenase, cytochrome b556 subunit [Methylococcaceae bacterium]MDD1609811.1 succinate dehydrogenase, cytochrome b556 subunit [Methylococcaceae bacterium]MDD1615500.1 succinate dehydrogenase, cytochrome b556 subunit [Methylococcaceae bacterium]OYV20160.1 MAG: succinate dehydrogenase cytochrome b556 subunit [Methylococcaceae bacterium NSP1-2]
MATNNNRPISPHLQAYKLPLTGIISITHRMTGVLLSIGLVAFVYIVSAVAGGANDYADMKAFMNVWIIKLIYWGFVYALFFHLCHGVRHLIWDTGRSFETKTLNSYALIELVASVTLTLATLV